MDGQCREYMKKIAEHLEKLHKTQEGRRLAHAILVAFEKTSKQLCETAKGYNGGTDSHKDLK